LYSGEVEPEMIKLGMKAILNRRAKFDYQLFDTYEAGIVLMGAEVKAIRAGSVNISAAFVRFIQNELYLINANITVRDKKDYNPTRPRKLLLHKRELTKITSKLKAKKLTLVPTKVYTRGPLIKLEFAIAKSKKTYKKKETIKKRDIERDIERELKDR
jgi:SsrA-binding protein